MPLVASGRTDRAPDVSALAAAVTGSQPQRAPTCLQRPMCVPSCPLARVDAPAVTCTRTWTWTGVMATAVYTRRVQTTVTRRYTPVHASTDHRSVLEPPLVLGLSPYSGVY